MVDASMASASLAKFLSAFVRHPHVGREKSLVLGNSKSSQRFSPQEPIEDFAEEFHLMGSAARGLGQAFGKASVFKFPLLLGERFMNSNAFIEGAHGNPESSFQRIRMNLPSGSPARSCGQSGG